ncbi:MAG: NAD-dependent epimerase/dehydratase family protein [Acidimicrobiales bacterium]
MSPTCVVTGSAGFIGSRVALRLLGDGWTVVGIDAFTDSYDPAEKRMRAAALRARSGYRHVETDLARASMVELLAGAEAVFHLAGRPGVRDSFTEQSKYVHDNVDATSRLVEAARAAPEVRRLVYASSSSVYGDAPVPFQEDGPTAPVSPYGETKLAAERICLEASGADLEVVALRYFTVYGPGQRPDMALRRFAAAALRREPLALYGDGTQSRDFTYVDDVVQATVAAASAEAAGQAVNVGGGSRVTLTEVLSLLEELVGAPLDVRREPSARGDVRHTGADLSRARALLGFRPRVALREGLSAQVEWLRSVIGPLPEVAR